MAEVRNKKASNPSTGAIALSTLPATTRAPKTPSAQPHSITASKADAIWQPSSKGSAVATQTKLYRINKEAARLLAPDGVLQTEVTQKLRAMGVDPATTEPLSSKYLISLPTSAWEGKFLPEKAVHATVRAAAGFLADQHVRTRGHGNESISIIEIQPFEANDDNFKLEAGAQTLNIGVQREPWALWSRFGLHDHDGAFKQPSASDLKKAWESGEHLDNPMLKKFWPLLNPTGDVSTSLRRLVADNSKLVLSGLRAIRGDKPIDAKSLNSKKDELKRVVGESVSAEATSATGKNLRSEANAVIDSLKKPADLEAFVQKFSAGMRDERLAASSSMAIQQAVLKQNSKVNLDIQGEWLTAFYGNVHDISVNAAMTINPGKLERFVQQVPLEREVNVKMKSKVVIGGFTMDFINVNATLDAMTKAVQTQRVHGTAALDQVLDGYRK